MLNKNIFTVVNYLTGGSIFVPLLSAIYYILSAEADSD